MSMVSLIELTVRNRSLPGFLGLGTDCLPYPHSLAFLTVTPVLMHHHSISCIDVTARSQLLIGSARVKLSVHFQISQFTSFLYYLQKTSADFHVPQEFDELCLE